MAAIFVSIGTNVNRERCIRLAVTMLRETFGGIRFSSVYETAAVGFDGDPFFNLAAGFDSRHAPEKLIGIFRGIENRCGRRRDAPRFSARSVDIDLLLYGDRVAAESGLVLPRPEITQQDYVLAPLAEIAPTVVHPLTQQTIAALWAQRRPPQDQIRRTGFCIDGEPPVFGE